MQKIKEFVLFVFVCGAILYLIGGVYIGVNIYERTREQVQTAHYERVAAELKADAEKLRLRTTELEHEVRQAQLKAYIKAFNEGNYPLIQQ